MTDKQFAQVVQAADRDGVFVVCISGRLDVASANEVGSALVELLTKKPRGLVLELAVQFLDSSALSMLLELWGRSQRDGVGFVLVATHNGARHALVSSTLGAVLPLASTVDDAVTGLRPTELRERRRSGSDSRGRGIGDRKSRKR